MKLFNLFLFSTLYYNILGSLLPTKKICKDCRHFIGDSMECRKFGDTNLVTGKVTYPSAKNIRDASEKCGENATSFEENHFKIVTVPYYFVKEYKIIFSSIVFFSLYVYIVHVLVSK
jgi:hypothetical protein